MDYATTTDLANRWRPLTAAEETVAQTLLGSASREIRDKVSDVDTRIADGTLDPDTVTDVVCEMVRRAMQRLLSGAESSTIRIDDAAVTTSYRHSSGNIYLTKSERSRLKPKSAFSISTIPA